MNKELRNFFDNHPIMDYFQKVIRYARNKKFRESVLDLYNRPNYLKICQNGNTNPGKILYAIEYDNDKSGFFAVYKNILEYLFFSDYYGLIPVIKYPQGWLYSEGKENPFEDFFEQPAQINWGGVQDCRSVVYADYYHRNLIHEICGTKTYYSDNDIEIAELGKIRKKYIRYQPEISSQLQKDIEQLLKNRKVLGIHVRGTDYKRQFNGHPVYIGSFDYIEVAKRYVLSGEYDAIFLATDDEKAIYRFEDEFNNIPVLRYSAFRSEGDVSVAMMPSERSNHKHMLGYEVIRDAIALSYCAGFIGNMSMVSLAAQIEAAARDHHFIDKVILNKGINRNENQLTDFENSFNAKK